MKIYNFYSKLGKYEGISPCKFSILTQNWKSLKELVTENFQFWLKICETVKGLVHANFQFWLKIEEIVKGLVHANFKFDSKLKKM